MCKSSAQNIISELQQTLNTNQTIHENSNFLKRIIEVDNKCQHWMDKYDELHDRYLRLESKCIDIEKENCGKKSSFNMLKYKFKNKIPTQSDVSTTYSFKNFIYQLD